MFTRQKKVLVLLILIMGMGLLLRIGMFNGLVGSDDLSYASTAHRIANGTFNTSDNISELRIGLVLPVALILKIAGTKEWALVAYPLFISVMGIFLAFIAGRLFFNERAGLVSAFLMAIVPIDAVMSTTLYTDIPSAFLSNVGIILAYIGVHKEAMKSKSAYAILAGLSLGFSWLTRESVVFILPLIGGYILWALWRDRRNAVIIFWLILILAGILSMESFAYWLNTGDPLFRFHRIIEAAESAWVYDTKFFNNAPMPLKYRILIAGPMKIFFNFKLGYVTIVALFVVIYALLARRKEFAFISGWFLFLAGYLNFGSVSLHHYAPLMLWDRYLYTLIFPSVVLIGGWVALMLFDFRLPLSALLRKREFLVKFMGVFLIMTTIIVMMLFTCYKKTLDPGTCYTHRAISRILTPSDSLYSDSRTPWILEFFWDYKKSNVHDFSGMKADEIPSKSYVLIDRYWIEFLTSMHHYKAPVFYKSPPEKWILIWKSKSARLYLVP